MTNLVHNFHNWATAHAKGSGGEGGVSLRTLADN